MRRRIEEPVPTRQRRLEAIGICVWLLVVAGLLGCESATHENIDRWMSTQKGPGKLEAALRDGELDPELRAHAGQNLVRIDGLEAVLQALEAMPAAGRDQVLAALVPRLWEDARIDGEMTMPSPLQVSAKDALYELRRMARGPTREAIDGYLIDWLTGGYYAARARSGRVRGAMIVRAVGPGAAPALLRSAKSLLVAPAGESDAQYKLEQPLLTGLAASGSPEAVGFLLDLLDVDHNDDTLPRRALDALHAGYVDNDELFELADPGALAPHLDRLVRLAKERTRDNRTVNDAIRLIGAAGAPACIGPLVELIAFSRRAPKYLWVSANAALRCGRAQALVPVADALPRRRGYARDELEGAILEPMLVLDDRGEVAEKARTLLTSDSWVARIIGVELLGRLGLADRAAADAEAVGELAGDRAPLTGWWGPQKGVPRRQKKKPPRLGERAAEVAKKLDQLSKSS